MDGHHAAELNRIRAAYRERDAAGGKPASSAWLDPVYRLYRQEIERSVLEEIARAGVDLMGARVLEVGCGGGELLSRFLDYGAGHAAGIDLMQARIEAAERRYPRLELLAGDASQLPWADESFDVVTQFTCLSSVLDTGLRTDIASEMWRVLAPGGLVISFDMRMPPSPIRAARQIVKVCLRNRVPPVGTPIEPLSTAELKRLFPAVRLRSVGLNPYLAHFASRTRLTEQIAVSVSGLRPHVLAVAQKPQPPSTSHR